MKRDFVCVERGVYKDKVYKERGVYKETRTVSVSHQLFSAEETNMSKETCACEKRLVHVKRDL